MLRIAIRMRPVYLILLSLSLFSCKKGELPNGEDNLFFAQFDKNEALIRFEDGVAGYGNGPGISTYEDSVGRLHSEFSLFITNPLDSNYGLNTLKIQMVKFLADTLYPSYEVSLAMFDQGAYNYGLYTLDSTRGGIDGIIIQYVDADSVLWTTDKRMGEQESWANFEVSSNNPVEEDLFGAKTKGSFNCRVFDGESNYLDLTNGTFHARTVYLP